MLIRHAARALLLTIAAGAVPPLAAQRPSATPAKPVVAVDTTALQRLEFRAIGPANMMGRATDVEGVPGDANIVYVGTAAGGVWKTINGGTTWEPIFDKQPTLSIGDFALEPGNPDVIYVGTGEANTRNSVSFGRGLYKSTDGGKSWRFLGLGDTRHIARVMVHPTDPRTIYVCAVGHIGGPSAERLATGRPEPCEGIGRGRPVAVRRGCRGAASVGASCCGRARRSC